MRLLKQSSTAQNLTFLMVSNSDHVTPATGLTPTVTLSKATGAFASPAGAVSEIGNGWYKAAGNATDTATLGSLILHATGTGADPTDREYEIVAFDPQSATNLGLTNLDATVGSRNATAPDNTSIATILTRTDVATSTRSTYAGADTAGTATLLARLTSTRAALLDNLDAAVSGIAAGVWAVTTRTLTAISDSAGVTTLLARLTSIRAGLLDNLDATVSSRNATAPDNTSIATILTRTDVATSTRSSHSVAEIWNALTSGLTTAGSIGKRLLDFVTTLVYSVAPNAAAIRAELDANSTKLDVAVSTRNATAPDNTSIATILTRTDVATSTRSTYAGADTAGTTTLLARLTSTRAALLDNLDAAISGVAAAVWGATTRTLTAILDSTGVTTLLSRLTSVRAGLLDNLDATVSSRSTYAGADTAGTATLLTRLTSTRAGLLDNLDAAISTRLAAASYTAPDNADIVTLVARLTSARAVLLDNLANLDAAISTRAVPGASMVASNMRGTDGALLAAGYTAPPTDYQQRAVPVTLPTAPPSGYGGSSDPAAIAAAVFEESATAHNTAGTMGAKLNAAGNAGDPWVTLLPGSYTAGQAGDIIGRFNIDPPSSPLVVVPGAPADLSLCRVYGYFENLDNSAADGLKITFALSGTAPVKSERFIDAVAIRATIKAGVLTNAAGDPWQDLQRNDLLTPAGTTYLVTCSQLRLAAAPITLAGATFDLSSIVT